LSHKAVIISFQIICVYLSSFELTKTAIQAGINSGLVVEIIIGVPFSRLNSIS
jgi:hypothetical protein